MGYDPSTLWEPIFISRSILSGVTKHTVPSQAASTVTPAAKGHRGFRQRSQHISSVLNLECEFWRQADLSLTLTWLRCRGARINDMTSPAHFLMAKMRMTSSTQAKP